MIGSEGVAVRRLGFEGERERERERDFVILSFRVSEIGKRKVRAGGWVGGFGFFSKKKYYTYLVGRVG